MREVILAMLSLCNSVLKCMFVKKDRWDSKKPYLFSYVIPSLLHYQLCTDIPPKIWSLNIKSDSGVGIPVYELAFNSITALLK